MSNQVNEEWMETMDTVEVDEAVSAWDLPPELKAVVDRLGWGTPTPIQSQTLPPALQGRDILGSAPTGTGKTVAFGLPLVAHLWSDVMEQAVILAPTRELATQVMESLRQLLGAGTAVRTALLIGGVQMTPQNRSLARRPRLVVGTPGRICDHLERKTLVLDNTRFVVLDEMDRMLDMGFSEQIQFIMGHLPEKRQTLLFTATLSPKTEKLAQRYVNDPVRVSVAGPLVPLDQITQEMIVVSEKDKPARLLEAVRKREGSMIVFVERKTLANEIAAFLREAGEAAEELHGDLQHRVREKRMKEFREGVYRIMVATDIAARGLDVPHVAHVVHCNLPRSSEDYIHRIGRTARAGRKGEVLAMVTPAEKTVWARMHAQIQSQSLLQEVRPALVPSRSGGGARAGGGRSEGGSDKRRSAYGRPGESRSGEVKKSGPFASPRKSGSEWRNRSDRPAKAEWKERPERAERPMGATKSESRNRPDRPERAAIRGKSEWRDRPERGSGAVNGGPSRWRAEVNREEDFGAVEKTSAQRPRGGRPPFAKGGRDGEDARPYSRGRGSEVKSTGRPVGRPGARGPFKDRGGEVSVRSKFGSDRRKKLAF